MLSHDYPVAAPFFSVQSESENTYVRLIPHSPTPQFSSQNQRRANVFSASQAEDESEERYSVGLHDKRTDERDEHKGEKKWEEKEADKFRRGVHGIITKTAGCRW